MVKATTKPLKDRPKFARVPLCPGDDPIQCSSRAPPLWLVGIVCNPPDVASRITLLSLRRVLVAVNMCRLGSCTANGYSKVRREGDIYSAFRDLIYPTAVPPYDPFVAGRAKKDSLHRAEHGTVRLNALEGLFASTF